MRHFLPSIIALTLLLTPSWVLSNTQEEAITGFRSANSQLKRKLSSMHLERLKIATEVQWASLDLSECGPTGSQDPCVHDNQLIFNLVLNTLQNVNQAIEGKNAAPFEKIIARAAVFDLTYQTGKPVLTYDYKGTRTLLILFQDLPGRLPSEFDTSAFSLESFQKLLSVPLRDINSFRILDIQSPANIDRLLREDLKGSPLEQANMEIELDQHSFGFQNCARADTSCLANNAEQYRLVVNGLAIFNTTLKRMLDEKHFTPQNLPFQKLEIQKAENEGFLDCNRMEGKTSLVLALGSIEQLYGMSDEARYQFLLDLREAN